jgi:hypothetical protein
MPFNPKSLQNLGNNGRGGRRKGVLNKATRWRRELAAPGIGLTETPTQILAANMAFFQRKADEILAEIQDALTRGVPAAELQRQLTEVCKFKIMANEAAVQLAPYVHSKMPTLIVQPDATTQQYVIRVPNALPDGQAWSHAVWSPAKPEPSSEVKAIIADTQVNGSRRNG